MARAKSHTVAQHLLKLRQELELWENTHNVKNLDQQMREQVIPRGY
jgi:hypothetical protein